MHVLSGWSRKDDMPINMCLPELSVCIYNNKQTNVTIWKKTREKIKYKKPHLFLLIRYKWFSFFFVKTKVPNQHSNKINKKYYWHNSEKKPVPLIQNHFNSVWVHIPFCQSVSWLLWGSWLYPWLQGLWGMVWPFLPCLHVFSSFFLLSEC